MKGNGLVPVLLGVGLALVIVVGVSAFTRSFPGRR